MATEDAAALSDEGAAPTARDTAETGAGHQAPETAAHETIEGVIERWFADHFHGSIISRDNAAYGLVFEAKEKLKQLLKRN